VKGVSCLVTGSCEVGRYLSQVPGHDAEKKIGCNWEARRKQWGLCAVSVEQSYLTCALSKRFSSEREEGLLQVSYVCSNHSGTKEIFVDGYLYISKRKGLIIPNQLFIWFIHGGG